MENETTSLDVTDRALSQITKAEEIESVNKITKNENHKRKLSADCENNTNVINLSPTRSNLNGNFGKNDTSFEKIKKWYNVNFMNKSPNGNVDPNIKPRNLNNKMDNRHSWHLNNSTEM
jgi:hypothetical protein